MLATPHTARLPPRRMTLWQSVNIQTCQPCSTATTAPCGYGAGMILMPPSRSMYLLRRRRLYISPISSNPSKASAKPRFNVRHEEPIRHELEEPARWRATRSLRWHSIYQPECQFDQSYNDDCAEDNELSENKRWSVDRANFDYWAPRAYRNVNDVLSADCALARWRAGVLPRCGGEIAVSHDDPPSESRSVTSR